MSFPLAVNPDQCGKKLWNQLETIAVLVKTKPVLFMKSDRMRLHADEWKTTFISKK